MTDARVLIVDDERNFREFLGEALEAEGFAVTRAATARSGLAMAERDLPDYVLLDQNLPDGPGLRILPQLRGLPTAPQVIVLTAYAEFADAVEAVKAGAFHYLAKPFEFSDLLSMLKSARRPASNGDAAEPEALAAIVGESPGIARLKAQLARIARSPVATVLLRGESGTGKELLARALHLLSARASHRLLTVNCATLTETLLMNELFGHERGAYTDARDQKRGLFETAQGGTLFLDEISEMSPRSQAALLRVIEQRTITRVGGTKEIPVDVRVVAATNRSLRERVAEGQFRADLYYRLSVVEIEVPPLRERGDDVVHLARHFAQAMARRYGGEVHRFTAESLDRLRRYPWPGNVRELRNAVERAYAIGTGPDITPRDLPQDLRSGGAAVAPAGPALDPGALPFQEAKRRMIDSFEVGYLKSALRRADGNVSRAARDAGVVRQVFQRLLSRHGIDASEFKI